MALKIKASWWKDLQLKEYVYFSVGLILTLVLTIILLRNHLPPVVPFFYGKAIGEGQLTNTIFLLLAPGASTLVLVLNILLTLVIDNTFLKKILIMCIFLFSLLMTITVFKIIFLVGFF